MDLVGLQGIARRVGDTPSSQWWVGRGQGWVQVTIRCNRNCTELGIWVERCRKKKEKRRRWVPHYPVTVLVSKLFSMLAAPSRILSVSHQSTWIPSDLGYCSKNREDFEVISSAPKSDSSNPWGQANKQNARQAGSGLWPQQEVKPWQQGEESVFLHAKNRHLHFQA